MLKAFLVRLLLQLIAIDPSVIQHCKRLYPMILLLLAKKFLKSLFSLTDSKCQSFSLAAVQEKQIAKVESPTAFSFPFSSVPISTDALTGVKLWKKHFETVRFMHVITPVVPRVDEAR